MMGGRTRKLRNQARRDGLGAVKASEAQKPEKKIKKTTKKKA